MGLDAATTITWYGHACVEVRTSGGKTILIDPWFGNPKSPKAADAVSTCDLLLVTHGHGDHMGDAVALASRLRPTWPCIHEMSLWLARRLPGGADAATGMNKGGTFAFGEIAMNGGSSALLLPSSHNKKITPPLLNAAVPMILLTSVCTHVSPCAMLPSCMSLSRLGVMKAYLGRAFAARSTSNCEKSTTCSLQRCDGWNVVPSQPLTSLK